MQVKSKSGRVFKLPMPEEEAAINRGIAADIDTYKLAKKDFAQLRQVGRPRAAVTK